MGTSTPAEETLGGINGQSVGYGKLRIGNDGAGDPAVGRQPAQRTSVNGFLLAGFDVPHNRVAHRRKPMGSGNSYDQERRLQPVQARIWRKSRVPFPLREPTIRRPFAFVTDVTDFDATSCGKFPGERVASMPSEVAIPAALQRKVCWLSGSRDSRYT